MKKINLQKLLNKLNGTDEKTLEGFKAFDQGVAKLKNELQKTVRMATLEEVNSKLSNFQSKIDFEPLLDAFQEFKSIVTENDTNLRETLRDELERLNNELSNVRGVSKDKFFAVADQIEEVSKRLQNLESRKLPEIIDFAPKIKSLEQDIFKLVDTTKKDILSNVERSDRAKEIKELATLLDKSVYDLRIELLNKISEKGGGNMNRQITVGGNPSTLSRYTDINFKAGSNVTLTYSTNETTKKTDITIAATGGSGSTRTIQRTAVSSTIGEVAGTDYVVIATQGINLTLPTAVSNTNLYTIKNIANSSVLVTTTAGQTIDSDSTLILATQYTSVDLVNDGNDNWSIT